MTEAEAGSNSKEPVLAFINLILFTLINFCEILTTKLIVLFIIYTPDSAFFVYENCVYSIFDPIGRAWFNLDIMYK